MTIDLALARARAQRSFASAPGVFRPAILDQPTPPLGRVLVELGLVNRETAEEAVGAAHELGRSLGDVLLERDLISETQLAQAIAARSGLPYVDLDVFRADPDVARLIGLAPALRYRAIPIADPEEAPALSDIAVIVKAEVRAAVATTSAIEALIASLPEERHQAAGPAGDRLAAALARTRTRSAV
jgi:hypothetical protein